MNLVLFCSNERTLINIGVNFDIGVVTQFKCILILSALNLKYQPFEVGEDNDEGYVVLCIDIE